MTLARKLTLALVAGMVAVLAAHAWFSVRREVTYSDQSLRRNAHIQGKTLGIALSEIWRREGPVHALEVVDEANDEEESGDRIRWVWLNAREGDPYAPKAPRNVLGPATIGQEVTYREPGSDVVRTYIPASIERGRPGAVEISTSTAREQRYVRSTIRSHVVATIAMAAVCGLMAMLIGGWFVGRPIRALVHKARRVGAGDLSGPLVLTQRDEIRVLADEMNAMCDRLSDAQSARIAALEQLRHADRLTTVGKLASGIAHEMGTPLNVVNGRARMIAGDAASEEVKEHAAIIVEQTQKMTNIIRQLLDFARRRGAHKSPQDLPQLARQTAVLLAPMADKRRVEILVEGDEVVAEIDPGQMQQALMNLMVNAIQAMPKGGKIRVGTGRAHGVPPADHGGAEGEWLRLTIADEGEGMSRETIAHMFEPFFTTKPPGEGTGLGLSVTYGIVREHGGWVSVESELGKGSTFSIWLPTQSAKQEAAA